MKYVNCLYSRLLQRAELCAQTLNAQKYLEFTEARQASFSKLSLIRCMLAYYFT